MADQLVKNKMAGQLPNREAAAFKRLMKCYEDRQFKQGLKFAKQILGTRLRVEKLVNAFLKSVSKYSMKYKQDHQAGC